MNNSSMMIVTIMDYPQGEFDWMLKVWMLQVQQNCSGAKVVVILGERGLSPEVDTYFSKWNNVEIRQGSIATSADIEPLRRENEAETLKFQQSYLMRFKLWNLCHIGAPYIFLDADAFVLSDLSALWTLASGRRFLGTSHDWYGGPTLDMNSGVMVVNDPSVLDWGEVIRARPLVLNPEFYPYGYIRDDIPFIRPMFNDQTQIQYHLYTKNIEWKHPQAYGWNASPKVVRLFLDNGKWKGFFATPDPHAHAKPLESIPDNSRPVHVVHYWGTSKPSMQESLLVRDLFKA